VSTEGRAVHWGGRNVEKRSVGQGQKGKKARTTSNDVGGKSG
jgi:hypothetical protein